MVICSFQEMTVIWDPNSPLSATTRRTGGHRPMNWVVKSTTFFHIFSWFNLCQPWFSECPGAKPGIFLDDVFLLQPRYHFFHEANLAIHRHVEILIRTGKPRRENFSPQSGPPKWRYRKGSTYNLVGGYTPPEKYESQIGSSSQLLGEKKHVPNHQRVIIISKSIPNISNTKQTKPSFHRGVFNIRETYCWNWNNPSEYVDDLP